MVHGRSMLAPNDAAHDHSHTVYHSYHVIYSVLALHPSLALQSLTKSREEVSDKQGHSRVSPRSR